jgi:hypothetical protein
MGLQEKPLAGVPRADNSIFHGRLLHTFHLRDEMRFQLPPPFPLTNYIKIGMEP